MSTTFPLPPECLQLIINDLAFQSDVNSLSSLLRVNKYFCSITLPILYGHPLIPRYLDSHFDQDSHDFQRRLKLIATLLLGVPKTHVTDLLDATFSHHIVDQIQQQEHQEKRQHATPTPYAPYHLFVTNIALLHCRGLYECEYHKAHNRPPRKLVDFAEKNGLKARYCLETPLSRVDRESCWDVLAAGLTRDLRRDLTWALCSNDLRRIKSLSIPLTDIDRYLSVVTQFKSLTDVFFVLEQRLPDDNLDLSGLTLQERAALNKQLYARTRHLDLMILFVRELQRHHNHKLQTAKCPMIEKVYEECPTEYKAQLLRLLPPPVNPHRLDHHNWAHFSINVEETNLSAVESIIPPHQVDHSEGSFDLLHLLRHTPFFHRCRSLKSIQATCQDEDVFQWAVDERRQHDLDIAAGRLPLRPLVPLEVAVITSNSPFTDRLLDSIGFAFGNTLKIFRAACSSSAFTTPDHTPLEYSFGLRKGNIPSFDWSMPQLSVLHLSLGGRDLLRIHSNVLSGSPRLASIILRDARKEYSPSDIVRWEAVELPHLETLTLWGTPSLSFNPCTLRITPNLQTLKLNPALRGDNSFIPVPELLEGTEDDSPGLPLANDAALDFPSRKSQIWTWDWELPKLTELWLTTEIAYRFRFTMLRKTPNLITLNVSMGNYSVRYKREISIEDLLMNSREESVNGEDDATGLRDIGEGEWPQAEFIRLFDLQSLTLMGPWTFDRQVLAALCSQVTPNIEWLCLKGCSGFDLSDWVKATSAHLPKLKETSATVPVTDKLLIESSLVVAPGYSREENVLCRTCTKIAMAFEQYGMEQWTLSGIFSSLDFLITFTLESCTFQGGDVDHSVDGLVSTM
ncbi:hypothetical protein EC991_005253 [Linnemannia zychae]|nr:hypothetical protein EC991_005253 [Linnemannia zychae]